MTFASGGTFSGAVDSLTLQTNAPAIASSLRGVLTNGTATDIGVTWTPGAVGCVFLGCGTRLPPPLERLRAS